LPITKCVTRAFPETGAVIGCIGALCDVALFLNLIGSMAFETVLGVGISTGLADTGFENHTCLFLQETNLWDLFTEVETKLVPILGAMEATGVQVDTEKLLHFDELLKHKIADVESTAHKAAKRVFSINSTQQLRKVRSE
jgi:hypothetical protein